MFLCAPELKVYSKAVLRLFTLSSLSNVVIRKNEVSTHVVSQTSSNSLSPLASRLGRKYEPSIQCNNNKPPLVHLNQAISPGSIRYWRASPQRPKPHQTNRIQSI